MNWDHCYLLDQSQCAGTFSVQCMEIFIVQMHMKRIAVLKRTSYTRSLILIITGENNDIDNTWFIVLGCDTFVTLIISSTSI